MKRLALFISMGFALSAGAQTPAPADPILPVAPATATPAPAASQDAPVTDESKSASGDRNCLKETGSRIKPHADRKGRKCINAPGAAYDREDLERTGANNIKDALRRLDPTVR